MAEILLTPNAARVRELRCASWWTQAELAKRAGVRRETVGNVENGRPARPDSILKIAAALNVDEKSLVA